MTADAPARGGGLRVHVERLRECRLCPDVLGPPVAQPVTGPRIILLGQAPGPKERETGRLFTWSAGRTLFRWIASIGVEEELFRRKVYIGAVIRCFPGRNTTGGGDRKPSGEEVERCLRHFNAELALIRPELVLAVGKMAIDQLLDCKRLDEVVGRSFKVNRQGHGFNCIPLPHPSGLSRWIQTDSGKALIRQALEEINRDSTWSATFGPSMNGA